MKKKHVVLVEDEQTLANLIELHLKKGGFRVSVAQDGKKGLAMILEEKPDLVLLDIMLPGLNGFKILEELHAKGVLPNLPVIIVSASGQPVEIERGLKLGVRDYLIKVNFNPDEVMEKVYRVLGERTSIKKHENGKEEKETLRAATRPRAAKRSKKVLLVEDEPILVRALERKFTKSGYRVFTARKVEQAQQVLKNQEVDVILLDIVLPDRNGLDFLKELKRSERWSGIPVVIISNLGQRDEVRQGMQMGAADYLVKAETVPDEIFERVHALYVKGQKEKV